MVYISVIFFAICFSACDNRTPFHKAMDKVDEYRAMEEEFQIANEAIVKGNYDKAFNIYIKYAEKGDPNACHNVALIFYNIENYKNYEKAFYWMQCAANGQVSRAMVHLGDFYYYGEGVLKDHKKAAEWYKKAAIKQEARAQMQLSELYYKGHGLNKNFIQAFKWAYLSKFYMKDNERKFEYVSDGLMNKAKKEISNKELNKALSLANSCIENDLQNC